ncbi:MAG: glycoside hydrolase domain-containing protein [Oligosphaeraceae bacterium]
MRPSPSPLLLTCLALLALAAPLPAATRLLYSFSYDSPVAAPDWATTESQGDFSAEIRPWPNAEPGLTGHFSYSASQGWPSAKLLIPPALADWRNLQSIQVELFMPEDCTAMGIEIRTEADAKPISWYNLSFSAGRHHLVLPLDDFKTEFDLSRVVHLDFFGMQPKKPFQIYIGDITGESREPRELRQEGVQEATRLRESLLWRQERLGQGAPGRLRRLLQEVEEYLQNPELLHFPRELQHQCQRLLPELDLRLFRQEAAGKSLALLWCYPEEKIHRGPYAFLAPYAGAYTIEAARGEAESGQLAGLALRSLQEVRARLESAPVMEDGTPFPLDALRLSPVGYVDCPKPHYTVDYSGLWPDPILEYLQTPFPLEEGTYQSWWLDAQVPRDQKPGLYQGEVVVTADGERQTVPFSLLVRQVNLEPGAPYFTPISCGGPIHIPYGTPEYWNYKHAIMDLLLQHRIQPDEIYSGPDRDRALEENLYALNHGARHFNLGYINTALSPERLRQFKEAYQMYQEAGILDKAYIYCFDEATAEEYPMIRETLRKVRQELPGLPIFTTIYDNTFGVKSGLDDLVDGWIPGTRNFYDYPDNVRAARERGRKVGFYVACSPFLPFANLLLEYPGMAPRLLMGFMAKKVDNQDIFLYYASTLWISIRKEGGNYTLGDPIPVPVTGGPVLAEPWNGNSFGNFNGDGRLLYPGTDAPLPSLRLKYMRDGVEDAMLLDQLRRILGSPEAQEAPETWLQEARKEAEVEDALVASLGVWAKDPRLVHRKHQRLLQLLEEFATLSRP